MSKLVVTAGFEGYTRPYREALGTDEYDYTSIRDASQVSDIDWSNVAAVVLTGGADIDPALYGQKAEARTYTSEHHDALDSAVLDAVKMKPIKKFGTCRGAQRLWAEEGGVLYQHIPHHGRDHVAAVIPFRAPTASHVILNERRQRDPEWYRRPFPVLQQELDDLTAQLEEEEEKMPAEFEVTSLHHQSCNWDSWETKKGTRPPLLLLVGESHGQSAVEAWAAPHHGSYGFQYHPEWMAAATPGYQWTIGAIKTAMGTKDVGNGYIYPPSLRMKGRTDLPSRSLHL